MKKTTSQRFIFFGIVLTIWTSILYYKSFQFYSKAIETTGTIIFDEEDRLKDTNSKYIAFTFLTLDGIRYTKGPFEVASNMYHLKLNDTVRVFYIEDDPDGAVIYNFNPLLMIAAILVGVYFVIIGIASILLKKVNNREKNRNN